MTALISPHKLSNKIVGILLAFLLVALLAISMTLYISWQLEGGAAAINDAGSLRMRSYRIGHLLARGVSAADRPGERIQGEMAEFESILANLERGDPIRPLSPPRDGRVLASAQAVKAEWNRVIRPLLAGYLETGAEVEREAYLRAYDRKVVVFVSGINRLVSDMERNYAFNTNLLRTCQLGLAVLAVIGTGILIRFFFVLVIRPVDHLHSGIQRMARDDFSVRLPLETRDEFGVLASGFNRMVEHLESVYATLEEHVANKTHKLAERNQELALLYETAAFLNEREGLEELCAGFIQRIRRAMSARAGAVRLHCAENGELYLVAHEGLSAEFVAGELALPCGQCLCGEAMDQGISSQADLMAPPPAMTLSSCAREGFRSASVFTITCQKLTLGVFNLYFDTPRRLGEQEMHLLETLGQHLGAAVENLRLRSREREVAICEERNLLAQELHDSIAQGLAFLNIQAQLLQDSLKRENIGEAMETAGQMRDGVKESYEDVRELLVHFRTRVPQSDIDSAILGALEKFEEQTGVATEFDRIGSGIPLAGEDGIQVLHIVQEALSNIRKHARATRVGLRIEHGRGGLLIEVRDDGVGFDARSNPALASERHVGLKIMKERAARAGGACRVDSAPGEGTRVTLTLPRSLAEES